MKITEFRVVLPLEVEEYQVGQLFAVADASKNETGGGEGVEVLKNEPYDNEMGKGQYTHKIYHLQQKVPRWVRALAPKGSLELHEEAWNAYPYCKTVITMPNYMKEKMEFKIETWHKPGRGELPNVHNLSEKELQKRDVIVIDIASDPVHPKDYKEEWDPLKFKSEKTGRGPLIGPWKSQVEPVMCCYKLVTVNFQWFGLQTIVEDYAMKMYRRLFFNFHRQLFCTIDKYIELTMDDIRRIEEETKKELDAQRASGAIRGTVDDTKKK
ncbi:phosphatidylinositol transfer protein alpha isoform-like [Amphiura filiformis]|uniref:phosphatidylinositol transfer protein alpha isoform-like n=1 Tax=Amphiura filiformis TaxID=82378 RepID=UPI003B20EA9B